jgi:hypothetical protein
MQIFRNSKMEVATDTRQLFELSLPTETDLDDFKATLAVDVTQRSQKLNIDKISMNFHNYIQQ